MDQDRPQLRLSITACSKHAELVRAALAPDASLELVGRYVQEADDCPDCNRLLEEEIRAGTNGAPLIDVGGDG